MSADVSTAKSNDLVPPRPPPVSMAATSKTTALKTEGERKKVASVEYKDNFAELKEKQSEIDANLAGLKATLQRIHAIVIIEKKEAPLLLNSLLEGKELSTEMIQKTIRGYISRRDFEHTEEQTCAKSCSFYLLLSCTANRPEVENHSLGQ